MVRRHSGTGLYLAYSLDDSLTVLEKAVLTVCAGTAVSVVCCIYFMHHFVGTGDAQDLNLLLPVAEAVH